MLARVGIIYNIKHVILKILPFVQFSILCGIVWDGNGIEIQTRTFNLSPSWPKSIIFWPLPKMPILFSNYLRQFENGIKI